MRSVAVWAVAAVLVLSACTGDDSEPSAEASPTPSTPATSAPTPSAEPSSEPAVVTTQEFCGLVRDIAGGEGAERSDATLQLLQRGLPADLEGDAHDGLQVLLDHATEFGGVTDSLRAYRALGKEERSDLRSLTWWVTTSCGKGYLDDLLPDLPDAPDWLKSPSLPRLG